MALRESETSAYEGLGRPEIEAMAAIARAKAAAAEVLKVPRNRPANVCLKWRFVETEVTPTGKKKAQSRKFALGFEGGEDCESLSAGSARYKTFIGKKVGHTFEVAGIGTVKVLSVYDTAGLTYVD